MSMRVGPDLLGLHRRTGFCRFARVVAHDVTNPETRDRFAVGIEKHGHLRCIGISIIQVILERSHGFWPERTESFFPTLAGEFHLVRGLKSQIGHRQVHHFLNSVIKEQNKRAISSTVACVQIYAFEKRAHLLVLQVVDCLVRGAFVWNFANPLTRCEEQGLLSCHVAEEGAERRKADVARLSGVAPVGLEMVEESGYQILVELLQR